MNRDELSVLVAGKMIEGKIAPSAVDANDLISPYRQLAIIIQKEKKWDINFLIQHTNYFVVDQAVTAAKNVDGLPADWPKLLRESAIRDDVGEYLEGAAKRLRRGEEVEPGEIIQKAYRLAGDLRAISPLSKLKPEDSPWQPTFWQPLDAFVGGLPVAGLTVVGAPPGTGKTSLLIKLACCAAENDKKSMIFSMEMTGGQFSYRARQIHKIPKKYQKNILVCDDILSPAAVASMATLVPDDLWFIGVDFAELMMVGSSDRTESVMAEVYQTLVRAAKQLDTPIVLLSQLNRQYEGGLPQINHLRYTGMAEALASLVLLIYNKGAIFVRQDSGGALSHHKGKAWIIVGKSRYGNVARQGGRFAIQIGWDGEKGWGDHGTVHAL